MKKLALLIGGEFRNFSECFSTWEPMKGYFDLFLSTWSTSNWYSDNSTYLPQYNNRNFEVTEEMVLSIVEEPPKYLNIESHINFSHRGNKQIYHWHRLLTTLINVQNEYEYALITRPDAIVFDSTFWKIFEQDKSFWKICEDAPADRMFGSSGIENRAPPEPFPITVSDWAFLSTPQTLINILLPVPYMKICHHTEIERGRGDNFHSHLAYYFVNNDHYIEPFPYGQIFVNSLDKKMLRAGERGHDPFARETVPEAIPDVSKIENN
jgi:hypothetical protein